MYIEILDGVFESRDPVSAQTALRRFLRGVTILPLSRLVAVRTARLRAELRRRKRPINHRALDIIIAGTALQHGLIMVTSDTDYDDIPGLTTLDPRSGQTVTR